MTYNELQSQLGKEVKILLTLCVWINRLSMKLAIRIRRKTKHLESTDPKAYGIFDYDMDDIQAFSYINILIASRYTHPRQGKVGEK